MANEYYTASGAPATGSQGSSSVIRGEYNLLVAAFDKLPGLSGNGGRLVRVNSGGSALEAVTIATALNDQDIALGAGSTAEDFANTNRKLGFNPQLLDTVSSSRNLSNADIGHVLPVDNTSSPTITIPTGLELGITLVETAGTGSMTLAAGSGMSIFWRQGGGSSSGNRTIAAASVFTIHIRTSTTAYIFGNGIS